MFFRCVLSERPCLCFFSWAWDNFQDDAFFSHSSMASKERSEILLKGALDWNKCWIFFSPLTSHCCWWLGSRKNQHHQALCGQHFHHRACGNGEQLQNPRCHILLSIFSDRGRFWLEEPSFGGWFNPNQIHGFVRCVCFFCFPIFFCFEYSRPGVVICHSI